MEGEHTPTIIQLIRSTDLAIIQLEYSYLYSSIPTKIDEHHVVVVNKIAHVFELQMKSGNFKVNLLLNISTVST